MPINWRTDYGIRLVFELAKMGDGKRSTVRRLAESAAVPYDYARTIVGELVMSGVLRSFRGVGGGVELSDDARRITVLDVFHALDEPVSMALCTDAGGVCGRKSLCPMHQSVWADIDAMIARHLSTADFARMVEIGSTLPSTAEECA